MTSPDATPDTPSRTEALDRGKLRVALRRHGRDVLFNVIDRAIDLLPKARLAAIAVVGHISGDELRVEPDFVADARSFCEASRRGQYYESFSVDSKNFTEMSRGTETWIAECERLFARCVKEAPRTEPARTREAFELLIGLLRYVNECHDDVVFWADDGGIWEVGVEWNRVLPVWFACLSATSQPEEYARKSVGVVDDFVHFDRDKYLKIARARGTVAQRSALHGVSRGEMPAQPQ